MPQHGDRQRGVVGLVRAWKRGKWQRQFAAPITVGDGLTDLGGPVEPAHRQPGTVPLRLGDHGLGDVHRIGLGHQRAAGPRDGRLLESDAAERVLGRAMLGAQQESLVIDAKRGDAAGSRAVQHVGRVEPPAQADLDHADVGRNSREGQEGRGGGDLEEAGGEVFGDVQHLTQQRGEHGVGHQLAGEADTLVVADEVRLGRGVDRQPLRFQHGAQVGAGAALAVGAGNVEGRRDGALRVAQPGQGRADRLQAEAALRQAQRGKAVELGLDGGIVGGGEIAHRFSAPA